LKIEFKHAAAAVLLIAYQLSLCIISAASDETKFSGKILTVKDGDSVIIMHNDRPEELRLSGIDCPEKDQPFGDEATKTTTAICFDKQVNVTAHGPDKYGRTIADVTLADGSNLNEELVRKGFAWWYRFYAPDNVQLRDSEEQAREKHLGLWAAKIPPIAPWNWRHGVRSAITPDWSYKGNSAFSTSTMQRSPIKSVP
jgi:micrococcal nuclease